MEVIGNVGAAGTDCFKIWTTQLLLVKLVTDHETVKRDGLDWHLT